MKIDKGIEVPEGVFGAGRPSKYPFRDMEVGDSLFFETEDEQSTFKFKPYVAATTWGRANGKKFSGRKVEGGIRIWRVE